MAKYLIIYLFTLSTTGAVVSVEKCGYVRRPVADTEDTVVISLDCNQSTPWSNYIARQLRDDVTQVALELLNCYTIPVGLFADVTENLTSLTVASEDAVQLLQGTFEGLERVTELRLLGFSALRNLSLSVFGPLRHLRRLVLDRFGSNHIKLCDLGRAIQALSGTPVKELVLNEIRAGAQQRNDRILSMKNFMIDNASVERLIVTGFQINYAGSMQRAFPALVSFCGSQDSRHTESTRLAMLDLILLSRSLANFTVFSNDPSTLYGNEHELSTVFHDEIKRSDQDLLNNSISYNPQKNDCLLYMTFYISRTLTRVTINGIPTVPKSILNPICVGDNNLEYLDVTGTPLPTQFPGFRGLHRLKYLSLEDTGIEELPFDFTGYLPALEVLKLGKLNLRNFSSEVEKDFLGWCPKLKELHLNQCRLTWFPRTGLSRLFRLERLDLSNNSLRQFDVDLSSCPRLCFIDLRMNMLSSISQELIDQLNELSRNRVRNSPLSIDLSLNNLSCQCSSINFVKWLKQSTEEKSNIRFLDFEKYKCFYPNGSTVHVAKMNVQTLEDQCRVIQTIENGSNCPCDDEIRSRLSEVRMSLDGLYCTSNGYTVPLKTLPRCFDPFKRPSFIVPVAVGGMLAVAVLVTIGLLCYYRKRTDVKQIRECLEMNPVHFLRTAIQYVMLHNRAEEDHASFRYDIFVVAHEADQSCVHRQFQVDVRLRRGRRIVTQDDFVPGTFIAEAMLECMSTCRWITPVITSNFLADPICVNFIRQVQSRRPHALVPVVWEQNLSVADISIVAMLETTDPLYWPGASAADDEMAKFWSSLLQRTSLV